MRYLVYIGIIIFACFIISCMKRSHGITMKSLLENESKSGKRIIIAKHMSEREVRNAIEGFIDINAQNNSIVDRPLVKKREDGVFIIDLPDSTNYDLFCYWVNYVVYSNKEKRYNKNITGWYEVPLGAKGIWKQFENQNLMFYVPETDTEFDNVYFTTKDNICYKQEFAFNALLLKQEKVYREYTDIPVRNNSENE